MKNDFIKLFFSTIISFCMCSIVYCADIRLNGKEATADEKQRTLDYIQLKRIDKEAKNADIDSFDISSSGNIAVHLKNDVINVYDKNGSYLFGYTFYDEGDEEVYWEDDELCIYFYRGLKKAVIRGDDISIYKISQGEVPIDLFDRSLDLEYDGNKYILESKNSVYDTFKAVYPNGNEQVILDVSKKDSAVSDIYPLNRSEKNFGYAFFAVIILTFILHIRKKRKCPCEDEK